MKPVYVICFYWQGERWQEQGMNYDKVEDPGFRKHLARTGPLTHEMVCRYVDNLYFGVKKWAVHPFKFICFTNDDLDVDERIEIREFQSVVKEGVMPRMFMYSKAAGLFGHQVLCLDIDVVITGSLRDLMNYDGLYCTRTSFAGPDKGKLDGDIQSFQAGKEMEDIFWKPLIDDPEKAKEISQGRERFWVRHVMNGKADLWNDVAPDQVLSYKRHVMKNNKELPENARIISCHGHPRPHIINEQWRKDNWE